MHPDDNRYGVEIVEDAAGWHVAIVDPGGVVKSQRACGDGDEARTYASTVRQHVYWLSEGAFRAYYRV
jgi:hypothetical protein